MRIFRSRVVLLACACVLAAASGMLFAFFPGGRRAASAPRPALPPTTADGELEFAETDIDLGLVNAPIKHDIEFTNRSDRVVRIGQIHTSCNCTTTQPDKEVLQPGERGRVLLNVKPRVDHVNKSMHVITIDYTGAEPREARLQVHYLTRPDVVVPQEVPIRRAGNQEATASFTLVDYRDKPLKIEAVTASAPDLLPTVAERPSSYLPGWQYRLEVSCSGNGRAPGDYADTLTLRTDDPDRQSITVRLALHQISRFRVAPPVLRLKAAPEAAEAVGTVYVDDVEGGAVDIETVTPSDPSLRCTLSGDAPHQTVEVRVRKDDLARVSSPASIRLGVKNAPTEVLCVRVVP